METNKIILSAMMVAMMAISGCTKSDYGTAMHTTDITFAAICPDTKSTLSTNEDSINDISLFIYTNGRLMNEAYSTDNEVDVQVRTPCTYDIYAIANCGNIHAPEEESGLDSLSHSISALSDLNSGFPMVGRISGMRISAKSSAIEISMQRLIAKINFIFDASDLPGLSITSLRIRQSPLDFKPFSSESAAKHCSDGDYATDSDLASINLGNSASFYMLENCQGTLLPSNTDRWAKIPSNITSQKDVCTYLEVGCNFDGTGGIVGDVTYRFYLGQDETSDFNIKRNTINNVTLCATEDGLKHISWKVSPDIAWGEIDYSVSTPEYIAQKGTLTIAEPPEGLTISLSPECAALSNGNMEITEISQGNYTISALKASMDTIYMMAPGYSRIAIPVEIKGPVLSFDKESYDISIDGSATRATAHYYDEDGRMIDESDFDQSLFARLLAISYSTGHPGSWGDTSFAGNTDDSYYVKSLTANGGDLDSFFGDDDCEYAIAVPAINYNHSYDETGPVIIQATAPLKILDPFPVAGSTLGRIDNTHFIGGGMRTGDTTSVNLTTNADGIIWTIEEEEAIFSDFTGNERGFDISADGNRLNFICRGTSFASKTQSGRFSIYTSHYPHGHCSLTGTVINSRSGQSYRSPEYYIDIYEHVLLCGQLYGVRWVADSQTYNGYYAYMEARAEILPEYFTECGGRPNIGAYVWSDRNGSISDPQGGYCYVGFPANTAKTSFKDGIDKGLYAIFNFDAFGRFGTISESGESSGDLDFSGSPGNATQILAYSWPTSKRDQYMAENAPFIYMDEYLNREHTSLPKKMQFPYEVKDLLNKTQYVIVHVVNMLQLGIYDSTQSWLTPVDYETINND